MMEFTYDGIVRQGFGFYNPNHAAALICALLPYCWAGLLRWKHPAARAGFGAAALVLTIALALTFSRSGLLIFFAELLLFGLLTGRRSWKVVPWIAAGGVLLFLAAGVWGRFVLDRAVTNRFDIWLAGASLFAANPWLGVGHGNSGTLATAFLLRDGIVCRTLVNSHLTLFAEYGLFPGLLWAGGIAYALIAGCRRQRRAAWVSFAGMCMAAGLATVFDWGVLFDFREWG
ncbi:O-antigen ligase, partial [uncultured Victivallis sp.]|uniref:O-antigen ligase family protein n=1 Tax=uncultured Victivallis sp. TaxID=354118 RepID=UPI0025E443C4